MHQRPEEAEPQVSPPLTDEQMILGEWEWQYSVGGWIPDTGTPASDGYDETLVIDEDTIYTHTYIRELDTLVVKGRPYEFKNYYDGVDSVMCIYRYDSPSYYTLTRDTLTLDSRFRDGAYHLYLRKSEP